MKPHEHFRQALSEHGTHGWAVMADFLEDCGTEPEYAFASLIRVYVEIRRLEEEGQPVPLELRQQFAALNAGYNMPPTKRLKVGVYYNPVGPFYTTLDTTLAEITTNWALLDQEPVRELFLSGALTGESLKMLLRNYRIQQCFSIYLNFRRAFSAEVADAIKQATFNGLKLLTLAGVNDPLGLIRVAFVCNKTVQEGATLRIGRQTVRK